MSHRRKWVALVAAVSIVAAMLLIAPVASAAPPSGALTAGCLNRTNLAVRKLLECVTVEGVMEHQEVLQAIADDNGGNRASGSAGYNASLAYIEGRMEAAGYLTARQEFNFNKFTDLGGSILQQVAPSAVSYVLGTDFGATPHSVPGDVTADVTVVDIQLGLGNASTSGCEAGDFAGFPAGDIALLQRGTCTFEQKGENAAAAGASGVLFFNQGNTAAADRNNIPAVTLGNGYTGGIPALNLTYALGETLSAIPGLRVRLNANVTRVLTVTENLIAETRSGDANNVIMAGAHLDSVPAGPGINDNGSGSSGILEVAEQIAKVKLPNKVRFAWWGAEEDNLVGSTFYVDDLIVNDPDELDRIKMYLNFDMIASPNYGLFIYDGDGSGFGLVGPDGSDDIEAVFERYFAERNLPSEPTAFTGRSDYQRFIQVGIPAGGLFTGAEVHKTAAQAAKWGGSVGEQYDPCYHAACDTIDNLSHTALGINADAIAYAVFLYATGAEVLDN